MKLIITCEHAGNHVPEKFLPLFHNHREVLLSHRGWDPGAWEATEFLSMKLGVPAFGCFTTRLLIEANRSLDNEDLFSEFSKGLSASDREGLIAQIYKPYRDDVEKVISDTAEFVIHISMHSFTPVFNGEVRDLEIGLLFDPARNNEAKFCSSLRDKLMKDSNGIRTEFNKPYLGTDDGFTTWLRTRYPDEKYVGVEIEINQKLVDQPIWRIIKEALLSSMSEAVGSF